MHETIFYTTSFFFLLEYVKTYFKVKKGLFNHMVLIIKHTEMDSQPAKYMLFFH